MVSTYSGFLFREGAWMPEPGDDWRFPSTLLQSLDVNE
jgi:hypothetical protein